MRDLLPFDRARALARTLGIRSSTEWQRWFRAELADCPPPPPGLPRNPDRVYNRYGGWTSWGDFLGTGRIANRRRVWRPFTKARAFARSLGLKNQTEWSFYTQGRLPGRRRRFPEDLPTNPSTAYRDDWRGWGDWLGTGHVSTTRRSYRSFDAARAFARALGLRTQEEWLAHEPLPADVPRCPNQVYDEWTSWGDFLGTGFVARQRRKYLPFREARRFTRGLGLASVGEWRTYAKGELVHPTPLPPGVPADPTEVYPADWRGYPDWLGTGEARPRRASTLSFEDARRFARSLGLSSREEWLAYVRGSHGRAGARPTNVPADPPRAYAQWRGWHDWLGVGRPPFRPFREARSFVRSLGLGSEAEWLAWARGGLPGKGERPADIPVEARKVYRGEFRGMGDWLGTGRVAAFERVYWPFARARRFARALGLTTKREWIAATRRLPRLPLEVPSQPWLTYRDEWRGIRDWLGTEGRSTSGQGSGGRAPSPRARRERRRMRTRREDWLPFEEARELVRALGLRNQNEWNAWSRDTRDPRVPSDPRAAYRGKWRGLRDWLGTEGLPRWRPFAKARTLARRLHLSGWREWRAYARSPRRPRDVPANPVPVYRREWRGIADWLGCEPRNFRFFWSGAKARPFPLAREFARSLGLDRVRDWEAFARGERPDLGKLPRDVPPNPRVYRREWAGWVDWLGCRRAWRPFEDARRFARRLHLRSSTEWHAFASGRLPEKGERPRDVPAYPNEVYADVWLGIADFLGYARPVRLLRPFEEARAFARSLGLTSRAEWDAFARGRRPDKGSLPQDVPPRPELAYRKKGWHGIRDFLRAPSLPTLGDPKDRWLPFDQARAYVRSLGLRSGAEWKRFSSSPRRPWNLPSAPNRYYPSEWAGLGDWLGTGGARPRGGQRYGEWLSFKRARTLVRRLGLPSWREWVAYAKSGKLRPDIPARPHGVYAREWKGMRDWLGTARPRERGSRRPRRRRDH